MKRTNTAPFDFFPLTRLSLSTDKPIIRQLIQILAAKGVRYCVISSGSRNAPLVIGFNAQKSIKCLSIIDERSAAFFALGIAQQSGSPVALVCTSGSAALNFTPALVEAYYQKIPLLALTADRPSEWIDQDDGQTIRQTGLFSNFIKASFTLPVSPAHPDEMWFAQRIASEAVNIAAEKLNQGPVHINIPLREPLYAESNENDKEIKNIEIVEVEKHLSTHSKSELLKEWKNAKKRMIICGMGKPNTRINALLSALAKDRSAAVITETTSNMTDVNFVGNVDGYFERLTETEKRNLAPDLLITFGGTVTTKKFKTYLRKLKPAVHWNISPAGSHTDTYQCLTKIIPAEAEEVFALLCKEKPQKKQVYPEKILKIAKEALAGLNKYSKEIPFSDLKVFQLIWKHLPEKSMVQLGNSTPIRYANLMDAQAGRGINFFGNRGVSGIDGSMSTAAGAAYASGNLPTLITGDLAFMYDLNALWNNNLPANLRIIVINNGGGGIFRIIDSKKTPLLEKYFEAAHFLKVEPFVKSFGIPYYGACDEESLADGLSWLFHNGSSANIGDRKGKPSVLEIFTPRLKNADILLGYFESLKK